MPEPTDRKVIQKILGLINHETKFLPRLAEMTSPLRELMHNDVHWQLEESIR